MAGAGERRAASGRHPDGRDVWLGQLERDMRRTEHAFPLKTPAHVVERDLRRMVEVRALQDGRVLLMRMAREDFERCLREYRHLPWTVLEARLAGGARTGGVDDGDPGAV